MSRLTITSLLVFIIETYCELTEKSLLSLQGLDGPPGKLGFTGQQVWWHIFDSPCVCCVVLLLCFHMCMEVWLKRSDYADCSFFHWHWRGCQGFAAYISICFVINRIVILSDSRIDNERHYRVEATSARRGCILASQVVISVWVINQCVMCLSLAWQTESLIDHYLCFCLQSGESWWTRGSWTTRIPSE